VLIGHDHLMDFPGGSDFNIAWEPMFVLFTPQGAADGAFNEHRSAQAAVGARLGARRGEIRGSHARPPHIGHRGGSCRTATP
jgi:hypothetical protein